jgi:protocatechuate 3,4-dioxygenase, alpha subunit
VPALTPSQTVGPFFAVALTKDPAAAELAADSPERVRLFGQVLDGAGEPVPDAMVEIWQPEGFGRSGTDDGGRFAFLTLKPRVRPGRAPHIAMAVFARGLLHHLWTRVYFPDETVANAADALLSSIEDKALRETLIAQPHADGLQFDVRLQGERQTCFLEL